MRTLRKVNIEYNVFPQMQGYHLQEDTGTISQAKAFSATRTAMTGSIGPLRSARSGVENIYRLLNSVGRGALPKGMELNENNHIFHHGPERADQPGGVGH